MDPTHFVYLATPTEDHGHYTSLLLAYLKAFSRADRDHFAVGVWISTLSSPDLSRFEMLAERWISGDMSAATDDYTGVLSLAIDAETASSIRQQLARLRGKRSLRMQYRTLRLRGQRLLTIARIESLRRHGHDTGDHNQPLRLLRTRDNADTVAAAARSLPHAQGHADASVHR